jgi:hypothetical protein
LNQNITSNIWIDKQKISGGESRGRKLRFCGLEKERNFKSGAGI